MGQCPPSETKHGREPCAPFLRRPRPSLDTYARGRDLSLPQGVVPIMNMSVSDKRLCSLCGLLGEFYAGRGQCKSCVRRLRREHHAKHRQRENAACLKRTQEHPGAMLKTALHSQAKTQNPKTRMLLAHQVVRWAMCAGRLVSADTCDRCGKPAARPVVHHEDYARPLWGTTLCHSCHRKAHGARILSP